MVEKMVRSIYTALPRFLAHADQPNERLFIVIMTNQLKYAISYTAKNRIMGGVYLNRMRGIIEAFLVEFKGKGSISGAQ